MLTHNVLPALLAEAIGMVVLVYVARAITEWRRERVLNWKRPIGWAPLGQWQPLLWLFRDKHEDTRTVHELRNTAVVVSWIVLCALFATLAVAGGVYVLFNGNGS